jgi:hypothetical protein
LREQGGVFLCQIFLHGVAFGISQGASVEKELREIAFEESLGERRFAGIRVMSRAERE